MPSTAVLLIANPSTWRYSQRPHAGPPNYKILLDEGGEGEDRGGEGEATGSGRESSSAARGDGGAGSSSEEGGQAGGVGAAGQGGAEEEEGDEGGGAEGGEEEQEWDGGEMEGASPAPGSISILESCLVDWASKSRMRVKATVRITHDMAGEVELQVGGRGEGGGRGGVCREMQDGTRGWREVGLCQGYRAHHYVCDGGWRCGGRCVRTQACGAWWPAEHGKWVRARRRAMSAKRQRGECSSTTPALAHVWGAAACLVLLVWATIEQPRQACVIAPPPPPSGAALARVP